MRSRIPAAAVLSTLFLAACTTPRLVNLWSDPTSRAPIRKALVLAVNKDGASRRVFEDLLAAELRKRGVSATPSYDVLPDDRPGETALREKVRQGGYDAALVTRAAGHERRTSYSPGYSVAVPYVVPGPFWGTYAVWYDWAWQPGYAREYEVVDLETTLWRTEGEGRVVWAGTLRTLGDDSAAQRARAVARAVLPELEKAGLVAAAAPKRDG